MSSIPVRRTTRVVRSTKDNENANARPSRIVTTRAKAALGAAAAPPTTRATASTAASKAKAVALGSTKDEKETGIKRKREVLVEVSGLATNNKIKAPVAVAKGKEGSSSTNKLKDAAAATAAAAKPKPVVRPPSRRLAGTAVPRRVMTRATTANATTTTTTTTTTAVVTTVHTEVAVKKQPVVEPAHEKMEVDVPSLEDEETRRVFKRRHTDEKPIVHAKCLDDSQLEADRVASELQAVEPSSASAQLWDDLDADDFDDPAMVSEYVVDVCKYLKEIEVSTLPNPEYMKDQTEITWEHRGVLIDWLLQVHQRFGLLAESLFLCVNILDRFLGSRPISIVKLQLVGLASFFIATKFEETYAPSVKEIQYLADNQYTIEEILKAERYILRTLEWDLRAPGPMGWLRRASKADDCEVHARTIGKYLLEVAAVDHRFIGYVPSLLAAAALWLARLSLGREEWTANLEHYSTYAEKEFIPIANLMLEYLITNPIQHEQLFKKYTHKRYFRCSNFMQTWSLERWPENGNVNLKKDLPEIKDEIRRHRAYVAAREARANRRKEGPSREAAA